MGFFSCMLSILQLGVVSSKVVSSVVIYTVVCELQTLPDETTLINSLSDRIGRKWVLAWLTVLLAVVSGIYPNCILIRDDSLHRRATVSNSQRRIGKCGQRRVSSREWETDSSKRNVSSTSPSAHPSLSGEHFLQVTLSPIRSED